jgi:uncharacterized membrane protein YcaP (DUF421 family)
MKSIEHLGQVKNAFMETSGEVSVFYYEDHEVNQAYQFYLFYLKLKKR